MQLKLSCASMDNARVALKKIETQRYSVLLLMQSLWTRWESLEMTTFLSFKRSNSQAGTTHAVLSGSISISRGTCMQYYFSSANRRVIFQRSRNIVDDIALRLRVWFRKEKENVWRYYYRMKIEKDSRICLCVNLVLNYIKNCSRFEKYKIEYVKGIREQRWLQLREFIGLLALTERWYNPLDIWLHEKVVFSPVSVLPVKTSGYTRVRSATDDHIRTDERACCRMFYFLESRSTRCTRSSFLRGGR